MLLALELPNLALLNRTDARHLRPATGPLNHRA